MNAVHLCGAIREGLPDLYDCAVAPRQGVRVRTPMLYPDGGVVDIFVLEQDGSYILTDFGDTLGWLRMQTINPRRTSKQIQLIDDACNTLGVECHRGQLVLRSTSAADLGETVSRLAQAAVRVSDIWFTLRSRSFDSTGTEVGEWLAERSIEFRQDVRHRGRSTRLWTVDFQTYAADQVSLVFLLSAGSRSAARRTTEHVLAGCYDLHHLTVEFPHRRFVSLFDDVYDIWKPEDFRILSEVSEVALWSQLDEFENILKAA